MLLRSLRNRHTCSTNYADGDDDWDGDYVLLSGPCLLVKE